MTLNYRSGGTPYSEEAMSNASPASWLKEPTFCEQFDYTPNEIKSKLQRKVWVKGVY